LALDVTIPANATAEVSVPTLGLYVTTIKEGGRIIWRDGQFVSGVPGITAGRDAGDAITFEVGSGVHTLRLAGRP
jgi:hypothetical protein